ncbi:uncharacterized protein A4U43_C01F2640 [Asparagus officinalis]|uniref:Uncharacterized protein n=1 Tax=Asparagus officinalis TaxID=4686 RepID=A0A5P1FL78_ASPOF|nr:uncharacterized protein A4U43_C01F2640 [Asparagus officinalis]
MDPETDIPGSDPFPYGCPQQRHSLSSILSVHRRLSPPQPPPPHSMNSFTIQSFAGLSTSTPSSKPLSLKSSPSTKMEQLRITKPDDWHLHLRDGDLLQFVAPHSAGHFGRAIVMPNLKPPVTTAAAAVEYRERILKALPPDASFSPLMTLYLTDNTSPEEIGIASESIFVMPSWLKVSFFVAVIVLA